MKAESSPLTEAAMIIKDFKKSVSYLYSGNDFFIDEIANRLISYKYGLHPKNQCVGHYMLVGPPGSGKSYIVQAIAAAMNWVAKAEDIQVFNHQMLYINGGEYDSDHQVAKLIGAPPGYLGHRETTPVFSRLSINNSRAHNSVWGVTVVLFDELDKASPTVRKLLLGPMERGEIKIGTNETVSLSDCIFFYTSNDGSDFNKSVGYGQNTVKNQLDIRIHLGKTFGFPFVNRLDKIYKLESYTRKEKVQAVTKQCKLMLNNIPAQKFSVEFTEEFASKIVDLFESKKFGMREMIKRAKDIINIKILKQFISGSKTNLIITSKDAVEYAEQEFMAIGS